MAATSCIWLLKLIKMKYTWKCLVLNGHMTLVAALEYMSSRFPPISNSCSLRVELSISAIALAHIIYINVIYLCVHFPIYKVHELQASAFLMFTSTEPDAESSTQW